MSGARFVRFYPSDWRSGCIGLNFEQQGFYIAVCAFIYDTDQRLPENDSAAAKLLGVHTNAYKKLRDQLAAAGKIVFANSVWTVPRAEKELAAAHQARQQKRPADQDTRQETSQDTIGDTPQDTPHEFSENNNKNNEPKKEPIASSLSQKERTTVSHTPELPRATGQTDDPNFEKCKLALNGSTNRIIDELKNSEGPYGTKARAAAWLADTLDDFGASAVLDAFKFLERCRDQGQTIRDPRQFIAKNAQRHVENQTAKKAAEAEKKTNKRPVFNRLSGEIEWRNTDARQH